MHRIAFCGSSGTGKSTLATNLASWLKLPINPVGSRSVAEAMGFASPYDVDQVGKRGEFQTNLVVQKMGWEYRHEAFVTDRTLADNLAYTILHDVSSATETMIESVFAGMSRYTHIIYCPVDVFCKTSGDPMRVQDLAYHRAYDMVLRGIFDRWFLEGWRGSFVKLTANGREERFARMRRLFNLEER